GSTYVSETFGDWEQRCVRRPEGNDPCQIYQLLRDADGNAVAEMSVFPLPAGQPAVAGSTIITPLETLLTKNITIAVDGGQARRYPFEFCA
ncbi:invasion associated locus B family protein, partial [Escherichia coli]|uniref:invasion associated locus B family protein n=1 Tax=Escherichia coli TaxID=562 RepID=UPI001AA0CCEA